MAHRAIWYYTALPEELISLIDEELRPFGGEAKKSTLFGNNLSPEVRNSENSWVPTTCWLAGYLWYFISKANDFNFRYDLTGIDGDTMQYSVYKEGMFYDWHVDGDIGTSHKPISSTVHGVSEEKGRDKLLLDTETVRKLSFSLQLSSPEDYKGGQLQLMGSDRDTFFVPKQKGTLIIFDSRTSHRVKKVTQGVRKSLVGWAVGPRWR